MIAPAMHYPHATGLYSWSNRILSERTGVVPAFQLRITGACLVAHFSEHIRRLVCRHGLIRFLQGRGRFFAGRILFEPFEKTHLVLLLCTRKAWYVSQLRIAARQ